MQYLNLRLQVSMVVLVHSNIKLMKNYLYSLCIIFVFACCNSKNIATDIEYQYSKVPQDTIIELLSVINHDSTLTESQLATKRKLFELLEEHLKVVDNHFVLDATPEHFENRGLSGYYYILYAKGFKDVNHTIDSMGVTDVEKKFKKGSIEKGYTLFSTEEEKL